MTETKKALVRHPYLRGLASAEQIELWSRQAVEQALDAGERAKAVMMLCHAALHSLEKLTELAAQEQRAK